MDHIPHSYTRSYVWLYFTVWCTFNFHANRADRLTRIPVNSNSTGSIFQCIIPITLFQTCCRLIGIVNMVGTIGINCLGIIFNSLGEITSLEGWIAGCLELFGFFCIWYCCSFIVYGYIIRLRCCYYYYGEICCVLVADLWFDYRKSFLTYTCECYGLYL